MIVVTKPIYLFVTLSVTFNSESKPSNILKVSFAEKVALEYKNHLNFIIY
mgnify:CR=1 FL=1